MDLIKQADAYQARADECDNTTEAAICAATADLLRAAAAKAAEADALANSRVYAGLA